MAASLPPAATGAARRGLAWAAVAAVFALMTLGNVVSATGSGLACPDWPLCHGRLIPPLQPDVLIEYSHRLAAALASILVVATSVMALRRSPEPLVRRLGIALIALLAVQIALGGITVLLKLPDLISTAHLINALLILGGLLLLAAVQARPARPEPSLVRLARTGLAALLVQLALGGYVRHSGAGLACPDFPLCSGDVIPGHWLGVVHWAHRWLGILLLGLFLHIGTVGRHTRLAGIAWAITAFGALQVALGIAAVLLRLPPPVRAAHAAVGYALWGFMVWMAARASGRAALAAPTTASKHVAEARVV